MKGLYFTDKHDSPFNEFSKPSANGRTTLLDEHYATYDWIAEQIEDHKPDFVVNVGDTVQTIGFVDGLTITCVEYGDTKIRSACKSVGAIYYPMLGNHDLSNDATRVHVLPFIEGMISEPTVRSLSLGQNIFFFPFYRDWQPEWDKYKDDVAQCRRAFIHLDIQGASFNYANICKNGISASNFSEKCRVIAGHFHNPQDLNPTFNCIGSVMYRNMSDEVTDIPRGIIVDEFSALEDISFTRIANPCTSTYHNIKVVDEDDLAVKFAAIPNRSRSYVRLSYPESIEPFVKAYSNDFRSLKCIAVKESRSPLIGGFNDSSVDTYDPVQVLSKYLKLYPPSSLNDGYGLYIDRLASVISKLNEKKSQHAVQYQGLHAENFMSYQNLDIRFINPELIFIDGVIQGEESQTSNGSGKSSIFEAIYWCLTGNLIRDNEGESRINVDDVVNEQAGSNCSVSLNLMLDGVEYQITRTRRHKDFGNDLRIWQSGNLVAQGLDQSKVYLGMITSADANLLKHTTFLVDNLSVRFSQLSSRARLELLEGVIQLGLYDNLYQHVHEVDLRRTRAEHEGIKNSIDRDESVLRELQGQRQSFSNNLVTLNQGLSQQIQDKQVELGKVNDQITNLDQMIAIRTEALAIAEKDVNEAYQSILRFDEVALREAIKTANRDIAILKKVISDKEQMVQGKCPTCGKPYESDPATLQSEIQWSKERLVDHEASLVKWHEWETTQREQVKLSEQNYASKLEVRNSVVSKLSNLKLTRSQYEMQIKGFQNDIQTAIRTMSTNDTQMGAFDLRINNLELGIADLKETKGKLSNYLTVLVYWDQALSPKGGCRMSLLQDALAQLSDFSVEYSNILSNGRVSPNIFLTQKGTISFDLQQQDLSRKYGLSSSGQRRMPDIAIQLALSRLSSKFSGFSSNLMILDEIDGPLDASARRHLISLLEKISSSENKTILFASHNKDCSAYIEKVWHVNQINGVSSLN